MKTTEKALMSSPKNLLIARYLVETSAGPRIGSMHRKSLKQVAGSMFESLEKLIARRN